MGFYSDNFMRHPVAAKLLTSGIHQSANCEDIHPGNGRVEHNPPPCKCNVIHLVNVDKDSPHWVNISVQLGHIENLLNKSEQTVGFKQNLQWSSFI